MSNLAEELAKLSQAGVQRQKEEEAAQLEARWRENSPAAIQRINAQLRMQAAGGATHTKIVLNDAESGIAVPLQQYYTGEKLIVTIQGRGCRKFLMTFSWAT